MYRTVRRGMAGPITFTSADATRSSSALSIATAANPGAFSLVQQATAAAAGPITHASTIDDSGMASGGPGPGPGPGPGAGDEVSDADEALCECYVGAVATALEARGSTMPASLGAALAAQCTTDPAAFAANLDRQGIDYDGCKPWYQRRTTFYVGGGVVALGLLYMLVRR